MLSKSNSSTLGESKLRNKIALPFSTEHFEIRPLEEQDREYYFQLHSNQKVVEYICEPLTRKQADTAFNITLRELTSKNPKILSWIIIDKKNKEKIGFQALSWYLHKEFEQDPIFDNQNQPEVGILLDPNVQGKGVAVEAMGALIEYAFELIGADLINLYYYKAHSNTVKFLSKLEAIFDESRQPVLEQWNYQYLLKPYWRFKYIERLEAIKLGTD